MTDDHVCLVAQARHDPDALASKNVVIEIFEPLSYHRLQVGSIGQFGVVQHQFFHETLCHTVVLRAGHWLKPQLLGKALGLLCCVAADVALETFNGFWRLAIRAKPVIYSLYH